MATATQDIPMITLQRGEIFVLALAAMSLRNDGRNLAYSALTMEDAKTEALLALGGEIIAQVSPDSGAPQPSPTKKTTSTTNPLGKLDKLELVKTAVLDAIDRAVARAAGPVRP